MECCGLEEISIRILLTILLICLLYIYGVYPMGTWKRAGVAGPRPMPFIGNMHQVVNPKKGIIKNIEIWEKQYGSVIGVHYFRKPCLVVTDAEMLKDILVKEFDIYHDRYILGEDKFIPKAVLNGLASKCGSDWKRIRRIMTPIFTASKLKLLIAYINQTGRQLADKLMEHAIVGSEPQAKNIFAAFSLDVIAGTGFGLNLNSHNQRNYQFFQHVQAIFTPKKLFKLAMVIGGAFPFTGFIFKKCNISLYEPESVQFFKNFFGKLVMQRKNHPEQYAQSDFFQLLLKAEMDPNDVTPGNRKLTPEEVVSQGIMLIMAGYQTTSSTLQYIAYVLATNHTVQDNIRQEIQQVVGDTDEVTFEHIQQLKYTEAVIHETLRMFPPIVVLRREITRNSTLHGIPVQKGNGIIVPIYNIGRNPKYFDDPDSFKPERFLKEDSVSPIVFLPFGFGPRQCIGMRLAMLEMKIAVVHTLKKVYITDAKPRALELEDYTGYLVPKVPFTIGLKGV